MTYPMPLNASVSGDPLELQYDYDSSGRLSALRSNIPNATTSASHIQYQPATDMPYAWRYGNGLGQRTRFLADGRPDIRESGSALRLAYTYDRSGLVRQISDQVYPAQSTSYDYEAVSRVTSALSTAGTRRFRWDRSGNRDWQEINGVAQSIVIDPNSNRVQQLASPAVTLRYDAAGK